MFRNHHEQWQGSGAGEDSVEDALAEPVEGPEAGHEGEGEGAPGGLAGPGPGVAVVQETDVGEAPAAVEDRGHHHSLLRHSWLQGGNRFMYSYT